MKTDTIVIYEDDYRIIKNEFDKLLRESEKSQVFSSHFRYSQHEKWKGRLDELDIKYCVNKEDPINPDGSPRVRIEIIYSYYDHSTFKKNLFEMISLDDIPVEQAAERAKKTGIPLISPYCRNGISVLR